jgi:vacuolar-type H+-ATPase subunit H
LDKAALLKNIKDAEGKAATEVAEARARKQQAIATGEIEAEKIRKDGHATADREAAAQVAKARERIDAEKAEKLSQGRVRVRRKREQAEARVQEVAEYLVGEFESAAQAGFR